MAESTLSLTYTNIREELAHYLGYRRYATVAAGLSSTQNDDVDAYFDAGYREFLMAFNWSFLKPVTSVTLWAAATGTEASSTGSTTFTATSATFYSTMIGHTITMDTSGNEYTITAYTSTTVVTVDSSVAAGDDGDTFAIAANGAYRMDDDFGGVIGPITFTDNSGGYRPLEIREEGYVRDLIQDTTGTGRPTYASIRPLEIASTNGQRFDMLIWRIPDSDYTVYFRMIVLPGQIGTSGYPYGGMLHAETVKYACLAAAERGKDRTKGVMWDHYQELLAKSIALDRRQHTAESLGVMRDTSDTRGYYGPGARINHLVTMQGTEP